MRKLLVLPGIAVVALLAMVSPAAAQDGTPCESTLTGVTLGDVVVPQGASCTLEDSTVTGDVKVKKNAFFQATNTDIAGKVRANRAVTVFIDTGSRREAIAAVSILGYRNEDHLLRPPWDLPAHKHIAHKLPRAACNSVRMTLCLDEIRRSRKGHAPMELGIDGLGLLRGAFGREYGNMRHGASPE